MDFRTEWSSWVMVVLMIVIAVVINPWATPLEWTGASTISYVLNMLLYPLIAIAVATLPVLVVCWFMKVEPDLDYSIRTAFVFMLFLLIQFFVF